MTKTDQDSEKDWGNRILHESPDWLVVDKPSGWLTIPGRGQEGVPVLSDWVTRTQGKVWVVHRIDRETSGIVLFARNPEAHRRANTWFEKHQIKKLYWFLASGDPSLPVFRVKKPIEGAASLTQVEVKERFQGFFLGTAFPLSGRRHQIRIHLAEEGHPLLGDSRYGGVQETESASGRKLRFPRVALHAGRLELPSGEIFECGLPADFREWIAELRLGELNP